MTDTMFTLLPARRNVLFLALLADTLLLSLVMGWAGQPLATPAAPNGIVSFELAGSTAAAQAILDSWDTRALVHAGFIQGLDFLYLLVYGATFAWASLLSGGVVRQLGWPLAGLGKALATGFGLAALCDFVENVALAVILFGGVENPWPALAAICAWIKFGLLFVGMVYIFYGAVLRLVEWLLPRSNRPTA